MRREDAFKDRFAKLGDFPFVCMVPWTPVQWFNGCRHTTECTELENCSLWSRKFVKQLTRNTQDFKTLSCDAGFMSMVVGVSLAFLKHCAIVAGVSATSAKLLLLNGLFLGL